MPKPPTITKKQSAEAALLDEQLVIPKNIWLARNPGKNPKDEGWEETVRPNGQIELTKWKNEAGAAVRRNTRAMSINFDEEMDLGEAVLDGDIDKLQNLYLAHANEMFGDAGSSTTVVCRHIRSVQTVSYHIIRLEASYSRMVRVTVSKSH